MGSKSPDDGVEEVSGVHSHGKKSYKQAVQPQVVSEAAKFLAARAPKDHADMKEEGRILLHLLRKEGHVRINCPLIKRNFKLPPPVPKSSVPHDTLVLDPCSLPLISTRVDFELTKHCPPLQSKTLNDLVTPLSYLVSPTSDSISLVAVALGGEGDNDARSLREKLDAICNEIKKVNRSSSIPQPPIISKGDIECCLVIDSRPKHRTLNAQQLI
ncbi:hypothetical protein SUGI_0380720 [Cryptomeria japonica]|nr:hypothetical protein SUGI_0380720 [Cryptomeria japonica]